MRGPRSVLRTFVVALISASAAAACGGSPPAPAPTPTVSEPTPSPVVAPAAAASVAPALERAPAPSAPVDEAQPEVAVIEPPGSASPLEGALFPVRAGKPLRIGDRGPAIVIVQAMLLLWNYPLDVAGVTGRFDEATAVALLHYRIDMGLDTFKGSGEKAFAAFARTHGTFDAATLRAFEGRLRAKHYRSIREIDLQRGFRFQVPAKTSKVAALSAVFPDETSRTSARDAGVDVLLEAPDAQGERAAWVSLKGYGCASASRLRATCR